MGILILFVMAIGLATMILYARDMAVSLHHKAFGLPKVIKGERNNCVATQGKVRKIYLDEKELNWNSLPKYNGDTGRFGLAKYKDVIVPVKHCYATVVYMDTAVKQYFYDLMAGWKFLIEDGGIKLGLSLLFFFASGAMVSFVWVLSIMIITLWFLLWASPSAMRATRHMAERSKTLTPEDWRDIYDEVGKSQARIDEMTTAFRRSGIGHRW